MGDAGQFDASIAMRLKALELDPGKAQAHVNLISLDGRTGARDKAREQYEAALKLDGSVADAQHAGGSGIAQWNMGIVRRLEVGRANVQLRVEGRNITNTPQFNNPGSNRSSLQLNPDGTIRNLNGYTEITGTRNTKTSKRQFCLGLRIGF